MALKLDQQSVAAARMILEHPIVAEIFADMEMENLNAAVSAKLGDDESRAAFLAEVRAIRKFKSNLHFIISQGVDEAKRNKAAK